MSFRAPKLPPAPPPPASPEDEASRRAREGELRRSLRGRPRLSLTAGLATAAAPTGAMPAMTPGRATVTGG